MTSSFQIPGRLWNARKFMAHGVPFPAEEDEKEWAVALSEVNEWMVCY